jgi:hypothetical protein
MTADQREELENPRSRPPLGLPEGSIRALLTLLILAVVVVETMRGNNALLKGLWSETLLIALAHYFTTRRLIGLPKAVRLRLEAEGHMPRESNPLFLPRGSIRAVLVLALGGLTYYVIGVQQVRQIQDVPPILIIVWSYLLGIFVRGALSWMHGGQRPSGLWADLRAAAVLLLLLATAIPYFLGKGDMVPESVRDIALASVLFYFGSR